MTNFIPIFPLGIVVYPGENVNLHIFEPRYKQLIKECSENKKSFGIPAVLDNRLQERGTLVSVTEVSKVYDNGEMDIKTKGEKGKSWKRVVMKRRKKSWVKRVKKGGT